MPFHVERRKAAFAPASLWNGFIVLSPRNTLPQAYLRQRPAKDTILDRPEVLLTPSESHLESHVLKDKLFVCMEAIAVTNATRIAVTTTIPASNARPEFCQKDRNKRSIPPPSRPRRGKVVQKSSDQGIENPLSRFQNLPRSYWSM